MLRAISSQSYDNIELIIVDGGSVDETVNKIQKITDDYPYNIKILVNKPGINQSFARNRGMMHANGDYIVFHDADDLSFPNRIERQVEFLEENPDVGVVGSSFYYINPLRNERTIRERPTEHDKIRKALARSCPVHIGSAMFRYEALAETHLFKSKYAEVYEILIDLADKGWMLNNLEDPLFVYRVNEGSISRDKMANQKMELMKRNYQAVSRLGLPKYNLILSLGWILYEYSPPVVKSIIRQLFAPDDEAQLMTKDQNKLAELLDIVK